MNESEKQSGLLSPAQVEKLRRQFSRLARELAELTWFCQGSVMHTPPGAYRWTRKVKNKTITIALSKPQAGLISQAIANHRKLEKSLKTMRVLSEKALLGSAPGVRKKPQRKNPKTPLS